jgi:hypothetical protein
VVGIVGLLAAIFFAGRLLVEFDWNPTTTIKFGEELPDQVKYAEELFGIDVVVAEDAGHDGKFFFSQAMDPFYFEPEVHAIHLDRPSYRAQRMLYPTLSSLGGLLGPTGTAWGLLVLNILGMGVGTLITARLAVEMGLSPWFGLAFPLNPGLIAALYIDGADIIAVAALMAAVLFAMRDKPGLTAAALTVSCLSRETMVLGALGLIIYWIKTRRRAPKVLFLPLGAVAVWWLYVHLRLDEGLGQDTEALGLPLQGFLQAAQGWLSSPNSLPDALIGLILLYASISIAVRSIRRPTPLGYAVAGFAFLALILSEPVWARYFDSARALAPVLTAYVLLVPAWHRAEKLEPLVPV